MIIPLYKLIATHVPTPAPKFLTHGAFGSIHIVEIKGEKYIRKTNKKISDCEANERQKLRFANEITLLILCGDETKNVAELVSFNHFSPDTQFYFMQRFTIDLFEFICRYLTKNSSNGLKLKNTIDLLLGVSKGIQHIHDLGVIHGDIKAENIVLDKKGRPFIIDFGLAEFREPGTINALMKNPNVGGSTPYIPPEIVEGENYNASRDIYALGILFLACRNFGAVNTEITPNRSSTIPKEALFTRLHRETFGLATTEMEFIRSLCNGELEERPSIDDIIKYLKWSKILSNNSPNLFRETFV